MGSAVAILQGAFGRTSLVRLNHPVVSHAHPEINIFIKISGARTTFRIGEREHPLDRDNFLVANSWEPHANLHSAEESTWLLSLLLNPGWRAAGLSDWPSKFKFVESTVPMSSELRRAADVLSGIMARIVTGGIAEEALMRLIALVLHCAGSQREELKPVFPQRLYDYRIRHAVAYMQAHPTRRLRPPDIAKTVGLSRSHFYRQFRACFGVSPQCFHDWVCMRNAINALNGLKPITEVSGELGFSAPSHFSRFFTQRTGMPPTQFRRCTRFVDAIDH